MAKQILTWQAWKAELNRLASGSTWFGDAPPITDDNWPSWDEYYLAGLTPQETLDEIQAESGDEPQEY